MIDVKLLRDDPELLREAARKKRMDVDVDALIAIDSKRREVITQADEAKAEQNRVSKGIGKLPPEERAGAASAVKALKERVRELDETRRQLDEQFQQAMLLMPNPPAPEVPEGETDADNVEVRRVGALPQFSFAPRDHIELGKALDVLDIERATQMAGSRQYLLKGDGARLEQAVLQLALDHMTQRGFVPMQVPLLVRYQAMEGTAYFPGGEEQAYKMAKDDLYLIGTSEVPLTSLHAGEILDGSQPAPSLRGDVTVLPPRGRGRGSRHPRAVSRASVLEGRAGGDRSRR